MRACFHSTHLPTYTAHSLSLLCHNTRPHTALTPTEGQHPLCERSVLLFCFFFLSRKESELLSFLRCFGFPTSFTHIWEAHNQLPTGAEHNATRDRPFRWHSTAVTVVDGMLTFTSRFGMHLQMRFLFLGSENKTKQQHQNKIKQNKTLYRKPAKISSLSQRRDTLPDNVYKYLQEQVCAHSRLSHESVGEGGRGEGGLWCLWCSWRILSY